jgi:hypothetical protein
MSIDKVFAQIACSDAQRSELWYAQLFGRAADAHPMDHLAEWHQGENAGMQLFEAPDNAGHSVMTLVVSELVKEHRRLTAVGIAHGEIEIGASMGLLRLRDPDGNLIVLAAPRAPGK